MRNFILLAGLLCFVIGCGPGGNMATGKVTLDDGSAAPPGTVMFRNDAGTFQSAIGSDGTYSIENIAAGDYQVAVIAATGGGGAEHGESSGEHGEADSGADSGTPSEAAASPIDAKYSDPTTSGITITVPGGDYNIKVERAGGAGAPAEDTPSE